jgi:serine/threonine protein kinase
MLLCNEGRQSKKSTTYRYRFHRPDYISKTVGAGATGWIGLLCSDPTRVLKYCNKQRTDAVQQLEREKRIYAIISHHPLIAHMRASSEEGICLEYYPLGSLRSYYESRSSLPELERRLRWCQQSVTAFKYLHSKYIVHGDISPRNILLSTSMDIKVCDFGFSSIEGQPLTGFGETRYRRFRPLTEEETSFMDDIFAIGCLLYEILTGTRPYADLHSADIEERYQASNFPSIDGIELHGFAPVIQKCWNECYRNIFDLEKDLPVFEERMYTLSDSPKLAAVQINTNPSSSCRLRSGSDCAVLWNIAQRSDESKMASNMNMRRNSTNGEFRSG